MHPPSTNGSNTEPNGETTPHTATLADQPTEETPQEQERLVPDVPSPKNPHTTLDPELGLDGQFISVNLPGFFTRSFSKPEHYAGLQKAIRDVFRAYDDATLFLQRDVKVDAAYRALEICHSKMIEWGVEKQWDHFPINP
ncbi:hypothetical protein IC229_05025 [Spirosoma sp. BT702]|uniref:Uncharacterized protein n=1 Tax=Spirosoma profusum TaxID=2771354 RepID=A0A927AQB2_9BACT|nr:hypothetical protein [Spirosoma profusum]MBD2699986.1 hypothetical protein [Spirosoma profusum]